MHVDSNFRAVVKPGPFVVGNGRDSGPRGRFPQQPAHRPAEASQAPSSIDPHLGTKSPSELNQPVYFGAILIPDIYEIHVSFAEKSIALLERLRARLNQGPEEAILGL